MQKNNLYLLAITASILFTACGSGSSSKNDETLTLNGNVVDGAIKNSKVSIQCDNKTYNAMSKTDGRGAFTIRNIPSSQSSNDCMLIAKGGVDTSDGDSLEGLVLKSNYKLFNSNTGLMISPLTNTVASIDTSNTDIKAAKQKAAAFLGIDEEDLVKDPTVNALLAKVAKKLTKIAKVNRKDGGKVGFVDLDDTNANKVNEVINYLDSVSEKDQKILIEDLEFIDSSKNLKDLVKQSISSNTLRLLKKAFKQSSYTAEQKDNLNFLAQAITQANIKDEKYQVVTKYQVRKALNDISLLPKFKTNALTNSDNVVVLDITTILVDDVLNNLSLSKEEFNKLLIDDKSVSKINIKDISSIILYNSKSYEKVLGDDLNKRREYYAFSDKSNISKLLDLSKNSFNDSINDKINTEVSLALTNFGFYDIALENIEDNVYTPYHKITGYKRLGSLLLSHNQKQLASDSFWKQFEIQKKQLQAAGEARFSFTSNGFGSPAFGSGITLTATNLSKAGAEAKVSEIFNYVKDLSQYLNNSYSYGNLILTFEDFSRRMLIDNNNLELAKQYIKENLTLALAIPHDKIAGQPWLNTDRMGVYYAYRAAIVALSLDEKNDLIPKVIEAGKTFDPENKWLTYKGSLGYLPIVFKSFNNELDEAISEFDKIAVHSYSETAYKALIENGGLSAALFINGKEDLLFNTYYTKNYIKDYDGNKSTVSDIANIISLGRDDYIPVPYIIKAHGGNELLEKYLDKMHQFLEKSTYKDDSEIRKVFATWNKNTDINARTGYLAMAYLYKKMDKESKAKEIIKESIEKINNLISSSDKISGYITILNAMKDMQIVDTLQKITIVDNLNEEIAKAKISDEKLLISIAKVLIENNSKDSAKAIIDKVYTDLTALSEESDVEDIEARVASLIGVRLTSQGFEKSIINVYFLLQDNSKVKTIINDSLKTINSLEKTVEQYKLLINVGVAYGRLNDLKSAQNIIDKIKTTKENKEVKIEIAKALAQYDAVASEVANIDSDGDSKPDFWNLNITQEQIEASGLELDDDIDNDGILDLEDGLAYDKIK